MKRDIKIPVVEGVYIAAVLENEAASEWCIYLINEREEHIKNVFVTSKGFGVDEDTKHIETSTLRHFFETVEAKSYQVIEPIMYDVFHLNNQYFLTFYIEQTLYDKEFNFEPGIITKHNVEDIPILDKKGISGF